MNEGPSGETPGARRETDPQPDREDEHWVDRWPISQRMALAIGLPVVMLVAGAVFVAAQVGQLDDLAEQEEREREEFQSAVDLEKAFDDIVESSQAYVLTGEARNRSAMESSMASFEDQMGEFEPSAEEQADFDRIEENASAYMDVARRAQGHVEEDEMEQAREVLTSRAAEEARSNTVAGIQNLQTAERRDLEAQQDAIDEARADVENGLLLATIGAVLATLLVGYNITQRTRSTLAEQTRTLQDSIDELRAAQSVQEDRHEAQRARIDATQTRIDELHTACGQIDDRLRDAVEMADEIEQAAENGNAVLEGTITSLDETDDSVSTVAERVLDIGEQLQQLTDVAGEVSSIADQIDMLALNASVEASHARGDSKGLDEIRDLAERSQERGHRIQTIVESAREESDAAAIALEKGGKAIDETRTGTLESIEAFSRVGACLEEALEEVQDIERLATDQDRALKEIRETIQEIDGEIEDAEVARERSERIVADLADVSARLREVS